MPEWSSAKQLTFCGQVQRLECASGYAPQAEYKGIEAGELALLPTLLLTFLVPIVSTDNES
ncbi:hypothetical protein AVEN_137881-1, partial [Araneus ventricosus]